MSSKKKSSWGLALTHLRVHSNFTAAHTEDEQARHVDFLSEHFSCVQDGMMELEVLLDFNSYIKGLLSSATATWTAAGTLFFFLFSV